MAGRPNDGLQAEQYRCAAIEATLRKRAGLPITEQWLYQRECIVIAAYHEACSLPGALDASAGTDVKEADAGMGKLLVAALGIVPVAVSTVGDHIAGRKLLRKPLDGLLGGGAVRHVDQGEARRIQCRGELLNALREFKLRPGQRLCCGWRAVKPDDLVPLLHSLQSQAASHPAKSHQSKTHSILHTQAYRYWYEESWG